MSGIRDQKKLAARSAGNLLGKARGRALQPTWKNHGAASVTQNMTGAFAPLIFF
jgi:hypothetical protein